MVSFLTFGVFTRHFSLHYTVLEPHLVVDFCLMWVDDDDDDDDVLHLGSSPYGHHAPCT